MIAILGFAAFFAALVVPTVVFANLSIRAERTLTHRLWLGAAAVWFFLSLGVIAAMIAAGPQS